MPETPFHTVAQLTAHADSIKQLHAALVAYADVSRKGPGCRRFEVFQDCVVPARFILVTDWDNEAAHHVHLNAAHTVEAFKNIPPMLEGELELREYHAADAS